MNEEEFSPLRWRGDALELLDQTLLPGEEAWLRCTEPGEVAEAIRRLAVRGAPAIGVAAAYGLALAIRSVEPGEDVARRLAETEALLAATRPTAVNLRWALQRGREVFAQATARGIDPGRALLDWAQQLHTEDIAANRRIGGHGAGHFSPGDAVLTHCNAGALATAGYGTALGVIRAAHAGGRLAMVWVGETRPLLQGARLTAWELQRLGIPFRLVTDSSAGALMARGRVQRIVVGADRIARNGDTANKIGTYPLAVLADRHRLPFYVAAPLSTIDPDSPDGAAIPIEERAGAEVTALCGVQIAPEESQALNLAFDVTPAELITAIVTEAGVLTPPYPETIARALESGRHGGPGLPRNT